MPGIFIDEQGGASVESLWKWAKNHERLRTTGIKWSQSDGIARWEVGGRI